MRDRREPHQGDDTPTSPAHSIADRLLAGTVSRPTAATEGRQLILTLPSDSGPAERRGLSLLAIADLTDEAGRWVVDLATIAHWRNNSRKDPNPTHWWSMVVPGLTTSNPIEAEDHIQMHAASADELDTIDPRELFSPRWTHDRVQLLAECLERGKESLETDEILVVSATIDEMSEWLQWREPDVRGQLIRQVTRVVEAISDGDANALFMIRASTDMSGEDIVGMIQRPSTPVEAVTDLRVLVAEALPAGDSGSPLHVPLVDGNGQRWSLRVLLARSGTRTVAVQFDGLGAIVDAP